MAYLKHKLNIMDILMSLGNFGTLIYVYDGVNDKSSGVMKVGNIPFKRISHWMYRRKVLQITPCVKNKKNCLRIHLVEDKDD